jgi:ubiquinone biosynthesis protein COQ9
MIDAATAPATDEADWAARSEAEVLAAALPLAPRLGWSRALLDAAAKDAGLHPGDADLLFPNGARDLAALLSRRHDRAALEALADVDPRSLKIRERIARAVTARIEAAAADEPAVRRASTHLALPTNLPLAISLLWESADTLWRWAGDTATDENHYSKRIILSGILVSTLAVRFTQGPAAADQHLNRQIEGVMAFEKWKAKAPSPIALLRTVAGALGKLRYG